MLEDIKLYLRIDGDEEDSLISSLIMAAKIFIQNATGVKVDEKNDLHTLAVKLMVSHSYENRLPIGEGEKLAFSLDSILLQMRYCVSIEEETTSEEV